MTVRLRIGELAKQQGLTIKALAARAGVAYGTAHALYTGRATRIDLDTLDRICGALQVEPGDVFVRGPGQERVVQAYGGEESEHGSHPDRAAGASERFIPGVL